MLSELHREVVHAARGYGRGGFRAEDEFLRQHGVCLVVILWLVVEAGNVESCGEAVVENGAYLVHAACHGSGRVERVHEVAEHGEFAHSVGTPLRGNLIADRPHYHRGAVAEVLYHVGDVACGPLVEEGAVAVW